MIATRLGVPRIGIRTCTPPKLLIVDDDETLLTVLARSLRKMGFEVRTARCGRDALFLLIALEEQFDLVLSDITMDGMSGPELLTGLRALGYQVPFCLMTAGHGYDREALMTAGAVEVFEKPFVSTKILGERLRKLIAGRKAWGHE